MIFESLCSFYKIKPLEELSVPLHREEEAKSSERALLQHLQQLPLLLPLSLLLLLPLLQVRENQLTQDEHPVSLDYVLSVRVV